MNESYRSFPTTKSSGRAVDVTAAARLGASHQTEDEVVDAMFFTGLAWHTERNIAAIFDDAQKSAPRRANDVGREESVMALTSRDSLTDGAGRVIPLPRPWSRTADDMAPDAIAKQLQRGELEIWPVQIGLSAFALDITKCEPCVLCGGQWSMATWARAFWPSSRPALALMHERCYRYAGDHGEVMPVHSCQFEGDDSCRACAESLPW